MKLACKCLVSLIVISLVFLQPQSPSAAGLHYRGSSVSDKTPVVHKSPEEDLPIRTETKVSGWTWVVLALLAAGGAAAALGGKGGDSTSSQTPAGTSATTGNTTFNW